MQIKTTLFAVFACIVLAKGQAQDFAKVDAQARSTPFPKGQDTRALAQALSEGCATEKEKVRAYFVWIANNIKYDIKSFENRGSADPQEQQDKQLPQRVLRTKKAVCAGYSNLLLALCEASGIKALRADGITKDYRGTVSRAGHAWCLVRADGVWGFIDATWGAGDVDLDKGKYHEHFKEIYFFPAPEVFIADHFPYDPLFQMLPAPLTLEQFKQAKLGAATPKPAATPRDGFAHLADSLNAFVALDSVASLLSTGKRTLGIDPASNYGLYHLGYYYYEEGEKAMSAYIAASTERQKNRTRATVKWCDEQTAHLKKWEARMSDCAKILRSTSRSDHYSDSMRSRRDAAESYLKAIQKERAYLKELRSQIE